MRKGDNGLSSWRLRSLPRHRILLPPKANFSPTASPERDYPGSSRPNARTIQLASKENINSAEHDGICKSMLRSRIWTELISEKKRSSRSADLPSSESLEAFSGSKLKKYSSLNSKNSKSVNGSTFFVGEPVPVEEARQRWPHHYARKALKIRRISRRLVALRGISWICT